MVSHTDSTIDSRSFAIDPSIINTAAYRRVEEYRRNVAGHDERKSEFLNTAGGEEHEPRGPVGMDNMVDQNAMQRLTPNRSHQMETQDEASVLSEPINVYSSRNLSSRHRVTQSEPISGERFAIHPLSKIRNGSKTPSWMGFRRKSKNNAEAIAHTSGPISPTPESQRGRRGFETSFYQSIDFSLPESLDVPPLVRAAQAGSNVEVEQLLDRGTDIEGQHKSSGRNALAVAAHCGNDNVVKLLLQHGVRNDMRDASRSTALHLAAGRGHVGAMQLLLHDGASVEDRDAEERTPLWLASSNGYLEAVELLLAHRAKVNTRADSQLTSLHVAAKRGDAAMADLLLRHGAHVDAKDRQLMTALHYSCEGGHDTVVGVLLGKRADIEARGAALKTPLMCAASTGQLHVVELLLKRKATLKSKTDRGMNALHYACQTGNVEVADFLINKKLASNTANTDGNTPLHLAVINNKFDVVELLLRKKAELELRCNRSFTALHYACTIGDPEIVELLLGYGAQIEAQTSDHGRPLHIAVTHGKFSIVEILLSRNVNHEARDKAEDRALGLACIQGHFEIAEALLNAGAPLRSKFSSKPRSYEDSPLCVAACHGHLKICTLLIARGASVLQKDERLWQPLRYAAYHGHPEIVELLIANGAEVTSSGASGGWGFDITASRIGFAPGEAISDKRKGSVMTLLHRAERREMAAKERETHTQGTGMQIMASYSGPSELPGPRIHPHFSMSRPTSNELYSLSKELYSPREFSMKSDTESPFIAELSSEPPRRPGTSNLQPTTGDSNRDQ